jgi:hypothetical protein
LVKVQDCRDVATLCVEMTFEELVAASAVITWLLTDDTRR